MRTCEQCGAFSGPELLYHRCDQLENCKRGDHRWTRDAGDGAEWQAFICHACGASKVETTRQLHAVDLLGD